MRNTVAASLLVGVAVTIYLHLIQPALPSAEDYAATAIVADQLQLEKTGGRLVRDDAHDPETLVNESRVKLGESLVIVGDNPLEQGVELAVFTLDPRGRITQVLHERLLRHEQSQIVGRTKLVGEAGTWRVYFQLWLDYRHIPNRTTPSTVTALRDFCIGCKLTSIAIDVDN